MPLREYSVQQNSRRGSGSHRVKLCPILAETHTKSTRPCRIRSRRGSRCSTDDGHGRSELAGAIRIQVREGCACSSHKAHGDYRNASSVARACTGNRTNKVQDSEQEGEERRGTIHWRVPAQTELIAMTTQAMRLRPWVPRPSSTLVDRLRPSPDLTGPPRPRRRRAATTQPCTLCADTPDLLGCIVPQ